MRLCIGIPDIKILAGWNAASIKPLIDLAELTLPHVNAKADYIYEVLHMIHLEYLGISPPGDITQHTLTGVSLNHLAFIETCRHFYYVEYNFPELVDALLCGYDLSGTKLLSQRTKFMIVDQG